MSWLSINVIREGSEKQATNLYGIVFIEGGYSRNLIFFFRFELFAIEKIVAVPENGVSRVVEEV